MQSIPRERCPICLDDVSQTGLFKLKNCGCKFCNQCIASYVNFSIASGAVSIGCPQSRCKRRGKISSREVMSLTDVDTFSKYQKMRQERAIESDPTLTFCPRPGCDGVCQVRHRRDSMSTWLRVDRDKPVSCPKCEHNFCAMCRNQWHPGVTCDTATSQLPMDQRGIPYDCREADAPVKRCPSCSCPIERTEGCAQVACLRCKHVFCWFCLQSLEDDFFLRHYDRGPCRNRLGHSRASVAWHRVQVAGVFIGVGAFLLVSSPLLLLAAPFLLCQKFKLLGSCFPAATATTAAAAAAAATTPGGAPSSPPSSFAATDDDEPEHYL